MSRVPDFDRLYSEHARPLRAFLYYRTGDRALSDDLLADTFERVLTAKRPFDRRRAGEKTWLYSIALNLLRDHGRRAAAARRALERVAAGEPQSPTAGALEHFEQRDVVQRALAQLAPEEREAISLRYGADLTLPEIAKLTGEKLTTVEGRVYRALRKLREDLS